MTMDVRPQWTEKLYPPSLGQDHLGLGSVSSDRVLPKLRPAYVVKISPATGVSTHSCSTSSGGATCPAPAGTSSAFTVHRSDLRGRRPLCDRPEHNEFGPPCGRRRAKGEPFAAETPRRLTPSSITSRRRVWAATASTTAPPSRHGTHTPPRLWPVRAAPLTRQPLGARRCCRVPCRRRRHRLLPPLFRRLHADEVPRCRPRVHPGRACLCQLRPTRRRPPLLRDVFLHAGAGKPPAALDR